MCFIPYLLEQVFSISTQQFLKNFIFLRTSYPRFVQMYDNNNNNNNDFNKNFIFTSESSRVDDNSTTNEIIRERVRYSKIILTQIIPFRRFIELIKRFPAASPTILISTELQLLPPCSPPSDRFKLSLRCLFLSLSQAGNGKELERVSRFRFRIDSKRCNARVSLSLCSVCVPQDRRRDQSRYSMRFVPFVAFSSRDWRVGLLRLGKGIESIERFHPPRCPLFSELVRACACSAAILTWTKTWTLRGSSRREGGNSLTLLFLVLNASTREIPSRNSSRQMGICVSIFISRE